MKTTKRELLAALILFLVLGNAGAQSLSTVQFSSARYAVSENAERVTITVKRSGYAGYGSKSPTRPATAQP